jgi:hypothetical protein
VRTKRIVRRILAGAVVCGLAGKAWATGYYGPMVYLDNGGEKVTASPEFYWELEVKRLASDFHPPEKLLVSSKEGTTAADENDFAAALQAGRIRPPDATEATRQAQAARAIIEQTTPTSTEVLPAEFPSEFADYHRGAFAYRRGPEHWEEARQTWEKVLERPESERHSRSVWVAFMLGKIALKRGDPAAVKWFERTRELARVGFADSLGMAADSYGWEGRSEWKQDHPEKAARLFLIQLALGDESAIVSLKALIPDREPIEGMLNYGPEPDERRGWSEPQREAAKEKALAQLKRDARDPLLRRLITAHILATASVAEEFRYDDQGKVPNRAARWLAILKELKLTELDDAEYIGWTAYNSGDYDAAARWLKLAPNDSAAALWLRAKLERRAGNLAKAAQTMAQAWQTLRDPANYSGWRGSAGEEEYLEPHWTFPQSASGDLGALHLERSDFVQALDTLLAGKLWNDAAFVAERVLTVEELKNYVEQQAGETKAVEDDPIVKLRYLLGRRLVREDRYEEAGTYLPPPYDQVLARYAAALKIGHDKSRPKAERARALFTAAWLCRHEGMELMGTEGAPDGFAENGNFEVPDLARQFRTGVYGVVDYSGGETVEIKKPIVLRMPAKERARLTKSKPEPDVRFHYRIIAAALALQAAALLSDASEELADVLNCAGLWVKERDEKLGNRYYNLIERRAPNTTIGRAVRARHWFVDQSGPWSEAQQQAYDAMRQELHFPPSN